MSRRPCRVTQAAAKPPRNHPATTPAPPLRLAYRVDEAAACIGISRAMIYKLVAAGKLKTVKVGHRTLIMDAALRSLLAGGE